MPPEPVKINCPACGHTYHDWIRRSVNLDLDDFDEAYVDACSSAVCPHCEHKVYFDTLTVSGGRFRWSRPGRGA